MFRYKLRRENLMLFNGFFDGSMDSQVMTRIACLPGQLKRALWPVCALLPVSPAAMVAGGEISKPHRKEIFY